MKLPSEFLKKMEILLGEPEFNEFVKTYDQPRFYGLRVNTLKISVEEFMKISPFKLERIPWTSDGFYYREGENPGRHPFYHAGLYYIQEPSAMLPGSVFEAKPGERVLDLCAAPGGKTVQIAAAMRGQGLLYANDISADRVKALVKNIELCGVRNVIVLNETPERLACRFPKYFDRILIDAPCSGEGMFRKDEDAARSWESYKCDVCSGMQREILKHVDSMLKTGGVIVYSTCTFSPEEDEKMISYFIDLYKNYELVNIKKVAGMEKGRPEWSDGNLALEKTARLWPHRVKGEGHFTAKLVKTVGTADMSSAEGTAASSVQEEKYQREGFKEIGDLPETFRSFVRDNLKIQMQGCFLLKGKNLYLLPEAPPSLDGLKVAKFGWFLGELMEDRFEPSHSMVTALLQEDVRMIVDLPSGSREVRSYLKGETVILEEDTAKPGAESPAPTSVKGLSAVCTDGYTLGWAKKTGDMLKNMYPRDGGK